MKILFVNEKCGYFGGVEQNIVDSASGLKCREHKCYLAYKSVTTRDTGKFKEHFNDCFPCTDFGSEPGDSLQKIIYSVQPDVIYLHKISDIAPFQQVPAKIRLVRMVHDHDLCCPRRHKYFLISGRICRHKADWRCWLDIAFVEKNNSSYRIVSINRKLQEMRRNYILHKLLVGSRFMKEELLQNNFPEDKVFILSPVVRMTDPVLSPVPDEPDILFVGQLIRGKGVDLLLKALKNISCRFSAYIVGTGNAEDKLKALCSKLGLEDRVKFTGWVAHERLGEFYSSARVVVVPSRWPEPFGMIGIEAMRHGRPVVGFDTGGIPDWLKHGTSGFLVPGQDALSMAKSIEHILLDTPLAARMGENALKDVRKKYSFESYLDQLESHLRT